MSDFPKQAIRTQYIGPTATKGAIVRARSCSGDTCIVEVGADDDDRHIKAHRAAAIKLCGRLAWRGKMIAGTFNGDLYWVFVDDSPMIG